jgi:glycosyltransferase involved in cell wall biosynthesis
VPSLAVIHDINFVHFPQDVPWLVNKYYNYYFPRFAQKAKRIATVSEHSKADIIGSFHVDRDKIDVLYNGCNERYKPLDESEKDKIKKQFADDADYFIFVGSLHPRKNIVRLLKAFEQFKKSIQSEVKLIIVGDRMFKTREIEKVYHAMSYKTDVKFLGRVVPETLHQLVGSAMALTFIPYFEGFGIPILEAMNCDVPVISSNVTSMPEVCGDAALLVNPFSLDSIISAMITIYNDPQARQDLIQKARIQREKFSWDQTADNLWKSIEKCMY